ncbi:DNA topoisomerase IV [Pararhodonellum marinum]|uniref:DNA topoisomerase IV n=1 Tax=Pararhodonellum marinum TaxID=2755358 RepID=UPI00188EC7C2|nr:DNA topoisomerase IV [Pararhodonellum marinum]
MYYRFGKVAHVLSIFFFLFVLIYIYSALTEMVAYEVTETGYPLKEVGKSTFFYLSIGVFVLFNLILTFPAKMIEKQATPNLKRIFPRGEPFRDHILAWIYSFLGILNVSLGLIVFYFHSLNNQNEISSGEFNFFFYLIPIFFVVWFVGLALIISKRFKQMPLSN